MDPRIKELLHTLIQRIIDATGAGNLHEEQEIEIAAEVEREVRVSRPTRYSPSKHKLDAMVRHIALYDRFLNGYEPSPFHPAAQKDIRRENFLPIIFVGSGALYYHRFHQRCPNLA